MITNLPAPGATVATKAFGPIYTHLGIMGDNGLVIHASKRLGHVVEESLAEFAQGNGWWLSHIKGNRPASEVISWARSRKGERWDLISSNCEHFVRLAHGLPKECRQIVATVISAIIYAFLTRK